MLNMFACYDLLYQTCYSHLYVELSTIGSIGHSSKERKPKERLGLQRKNFSFLRRFVANRTFAIRNSHRPISLEERTIDARDVSLILFNSERDVQLTSETEFRQTFSMTPLSVFIHCLYKTNDGLFKPVLKQLYFHIAVMLNANAVLKLFLKMLIERIHCNQKCHFGNLLTPKY